MRTGSLSPARACAEPVRSKIKKVDHTASPMPEIHRPARLATRAASFRYGGRHHPGIPGGIIPLSPGGFVGIRKQERVLTLLSQSEGASIEEMMQATDWQQHSVRGFLAGTVKRKLGFSL